MRFKNAFGLIANLFWSAALLAEPQNHANMHHHHSETMQCPEGQQWDLSSAMCQPLAQDDQSVSQAMLHGNIFGVGTTTQGPRGRTATLSPNMLMFDIGKNWGDRNYFSFSFMGTLERFTYPTIGYPELLQVGERDDIGRPYIDAQHPHSTPIMGLTLSDTIRLDSDNDYIKIFAAPRGESTDGPIAFMHRATGVVNPDAPLGHHIGQDVGHISSSVIGFSLKIDSSWIESSTFYGLEPDPTKIDLPISKPNSFAVRVAHKFGSDTLVMGSFASVKNPEPDSVDPTYVSRYSVSLYNHFPLTPTWNFYNTLIYGLIYGYDQTSSLTSWGEEFLFAGSAPRIWGRVEMVQRTPAELAISGGISDFYIPRWVGAFTLGYTHKILEFSDSVELGVGTSGTVDIIPSEFVAAYGSMPLTGKIFIQLGGMKHWNLSAD